MTTTTTALFHTFGHTADGEPVTFRPHQHAHALIVGGTGTGKTVAAATAATAFLDQGADVAVLSRTSQGWTTYAPTLSEKIITDPAQQHDKISETHDLLSERYDLIRQNKNDPADFSPSIVVVDSLLRALARNAEGFSREAFNMVISIIRLGRAARVHLIATAQRVDSESVPGEIRDNVGFLVQYGNLSYEAGMLLWGNPDDARAAGQVGAGTLRARGITADNNNKPDLFTPTPLSTP